MEQSNSLINKRNISNIIKVSLVSLFSLGASLLSGFLIPKILSINSYGYYQTALLYAAYLGVAPLGFLDGIILRYAGKSEEELPSDRFRFYWRIMFLLHLVLGGIFITFGLTLFKGLEKWIFIYLGLQLFFGNISSFFANISTLTSNFKLYNKVSFSATVLRFFNLVIVAVLYIFRKSLISDAPFYIFLGLSLIPTILMFFIYLFRYKSFTFKRNSDASFNKRREVFDLVKIGLPLLISNLLITFLLESDRQFVQIAFDISTYAIYAFAYSLLGLISKLFMSISLVLFPELKKIDSKSAFDQYQNLIGTLLVIISILCLGYFLVHGIVVLWIPKYLGSLKIFRVVISSYLCYASVVIINQNYYKANLMNVRFLIISVFALALAVSLNFAAFYAFGTTYSISLATLITLFIWFIVTSFSLSKKVHFKDRNNYLFLIIFILGYNLCSMLSFWKDFVLSSALLVLLIFLFERDVAARFKIAIGKIRKINRIKS